MNLPNRHRLIALSLAIAASPLLAGAQEPAGGDQVLVVARTVHGRIAYRALPARSNPVMAQAVVFPGTAFHGALDQTTGSLVGDDVLAALGAGGLSSTVADGSPARMAGLPIGAAMAPLGAAGGAAGGTRATSTIAGLITQTVAHATLGGGP